MSKTGSLSIPPIHPLSYPIEQRSRKKYRGFDVDTLPETYQSNSSEEEAVLEYVDNFRKQFSQLYPQRCDLLLFPKNECNIPVCSTKF
jgi:hypothetical protein